MRSLWILVLLAVGCVPGDLARGRFACGVDADCATGWWCDHGFCCDERGGCTGEDGAPDAGPGPGPADAGCEPESDLAFCERLGRQCGNASGEDVCGDARQVASCGTCVASKTCENGSCVCVPESDAVFCGRLGKSCGPLTAPDNCGSSRTVASCGACGGTCTGGICSVCTPESDATFCARLGTSCGAKSGTDNCGSPRSVAACAPGCSGNATCVSGSCCHPACSGRQCGDDGCGGSCGTCASPPPADCANATTRRTYAAAGSCSAAGLCQYAPTTTVCTTSVANADPTCSAGTCGFACRPGFAVSGATCVAVPPLQPNAPWPMHRGGPLHQARLVAGTVHTSMTQRWAAAGGGPLDTAAPAIAADGTVYTPSSNGLVAIDSAGNKKWTATTAVIEGTPAIGGDGTVYVGSTNQSFYAINPNGTIKWSFATGGQIHSSPVISPAGLIYFGSDDGKVYALDTAGQLRWTYTTGAEVLSSPALAPDGTVYVGSMGGTFYAFNPDLTVKWSKTGFTAVKSSPAIAADGTVYFGARDDRVHALKPIDGSPKWSYPLGVDVDSSPAVAADGSVYVAAGGLLHAFSPTGSHLWNALMAYTSDCSPVIGAGGTIFIPDDNGAADHEGGYVRVVSPGSSGPDYMTGFTAHLNSELALGADGAVYVLSWNGLVVVNP